jgi:hypothetical protein
MNKKRIFIGVILAILALLLFVAIPYFKTRRSTSSKSTSDSRRTAWGGGARAVNKPWCTPQELGGYAQEIVSGKKLYKDLPCRSPHLAHLTSLDAPGLDPEYVLALRVYGMKPFVNRNTCDAYGFGLLGVDFGANSKTLNYYKNTCGYFRSRDGLPQGRTDCEKLNDINFSPQSQS